MADIIMNFEKGLGSYLTKEQINEQAPLVFAKAPTNPNITDKYLFVNTETIVNDLAKLNWFPVEVAQRKTRKEEGTIFSKHMVSFQNPDIKITSEDGDDAYPRILLTNSHDGMNSFQFRVGIFRLVCSNGLVIATEEFESFKIRHTQSVEGRIQVARETLGMALGYFDEFEVEKWASNNIMIVTTITLESGIQHVLDFYVSEGRYDVGKSGEKKS